MISSRKYGRANDMCYTLDGETCELCGCPIAYDSELQVGYCTKTDYELSEPPEDTPSLELPIERYTER